MSTRSVVAIRDPQKRNDVKGVYVHYDGYPSGVGKALYDVLHNAPNPQEVVDTLLSKLSGWSTVTKWNGNNGFVIGYDAMENRMNTVAGYDFEAREKVREGYAVYYDGSRADPNDKHWDKKQIIGDMFIEWVYLINKKRVYVFENFSNKIVFRGSFDYTKDEPNWIDFTEVEEEDD